MSRGTEVYARAFDSVFLTLSPRTRELIESKIHDLGTRLSTHCTIGLKDDLNIGFASVITVSSTNLICRRTFCIWSHWVIAAKFIAEPVEIGAWCQ